MIETLNLDDIGLILWINIFSITVCIYLLSHIITNQKLEYQSRYIFWILISLFIFIFSLSSIVIVNVMKSDWILRLFLLIITSIIFPALSILYAISRWYLKGHGWYIKFYIMIFIILVIDVSIILSIIHFFNKIPLIESLIISGWILLSIIFYNYINALFGYILVIYKKRFLLLFDHSLNTLKLKKEYPNKNYIENRFPTGLKLLDKLLFSESENDTYRGINAGSVILFEGETGTNVGHLMVHLLYLGLQQGSYSMYITANRPASAVLESFDNNIERANENIENFIKSIMSLKELLKKNKTLRESIIRDLIYYLEKFTYNNLWGEHAGKLEMELKSMLADERGFSKEDLKNLIKNKLIDKENMLEQNDKEDDNILPKLKDYLKSRKEGKPGLLFIVDYNASLLGEEKAISRKGEDEDYKKYLEVDFKDQCFNITNAYDIENLHDCLKTIKMIITMKDPNRQKPIRQFYDSTSTIFHLTARDQDMSHKTMAMLFHQFSSAKENEYLIFHSFKKGLSEDKYLGYLEDVADGIVSLSIDRELADVPFRFLQVIKMETITSATNKLPYRLKDGLIEEIWW